MTRDEIICMAREAGWHGIYAKPFMSICLKEDELLHFAELIAAAEREACARVCDKYAKYSSNPMNFAENCAESIRVRGKP